MSDVRLTCPSCQRYLATVGAGTRLELAPCPNCGTQTTVSKTALSRRTAGQALRIVASHPLTASGGEV